MNRAYERLGVLSNFDSNHALVTSPIMSPKVLAVIRLSLAFYTLFTNIFIFAWNGAKLHVADGYLSYFTHLSYIGICAYFFASGVQTFAYARGNSKDYPLQHWPKFLQVLHLLLYSTIATFPFLVTIMFWVILFDKDTFATQFSTFSNISQHALNSALALFEILCTHAGPLPWLHLPILILILICYLGVAYITFADQHFYVYNFLNPGKQHALLAGYIIGVAVAECIIFIVIRYVIVLREKLSARRTGGVDPKSGPQQQIDEWEEVERPSSVV